MNTGFMDEPLENPCTHSRTYRVSDIPMVFCDLCGDPLGNDFPMKMPVHRETIGSVTYEVSNGRRWSSHTWPETLMFLALGAAAMFGVALVIGVLARNFQ